VAVASSRRFWNYRNFRRRLEATATVYKPLLARTWDGFVASAFGGLLPGAGRLDCGDRFGKRAVEFQGPGRSDLDGGVGVLCGGKNAHCETDHPLGTVPNAQCETDRPLGTVPSAHCVTDCPLATLPSAHSVTDRPFGTVPSAHSVTDRLLGTAPSVHSVTDRPSPTVPEVHCVTDRPPLGLSDHSPPFWPNLDEIDRRRSPHRSAKRQVQSTENPCRAGEPGVNKSQMNTHPPTGRLRSRPGGITR